jgi:predicted metal-dependent phosphotriesterase family hydrolase
MSHLDPAGAVVDPTVWGLGRYIPRIQRIAAQTPVNIILATGPYAYEELPQQYAYRGPGTLIEMPEPMVTDFAPSMVLAHDANCFIDYFGAAHDQLRPIAAPNWHYEHISDDVLPALLEAGVTQAQLDTMLTENPVRYFTPTGGSAA